MTDDDILREDAATQLADMQRRHALASVILDDFVAGAADEEIEDLVTSLDSQVAENPGSTIEQKIERLIAAAAGAEISRLLCEELKRVIDERSRKN